MSSYHSRPTIRRMCVVFNILSALVGSLCHPAANGAVTTAWTAFLEFLRQCPRVRKGIDTLEITPPLGATEDDSTTASEVDMHSLSGLVGMLPDLAHLELTAVKLLASEAPPPVFSTLSSFDYDAYNDGSQYTMDELFNLLLPPIARARSIRISNSSFSRQEPFVLKSRLHFERLSELNMRDNEGMGVVIENLTQLVHDGCLRASARSPSVRSCLETSPASTVSSLPLVVS